ncbi:hypothetical protein [Desulfovibrio sp.]|uniref:hypothetical protein n=1 Tax=Desulfovibrio sp. TaxID=885 RepID=UPI0025BC6D4D|nr:hypothetical protein [Desulfovibrio sp.]
MRHMDGTPVAPEGASPETTPDDALAGTPRQALDNFAALFEDADFTVELDYLGVGRMQFLRRRQMLLELRGLYVALWRLALARSFPQDAGQMFDTFLQEYKAGHKDRTNAQVLVRAREYWGMLEPMGDGDFSEVARHLTSFFARTDQGDKSVNLKLVLHIRKVYQLIFDRLI